MKFNISMPSKKTMGLTAFGFAVGGITAYLAAAHTLPFTGALSQFGGTQEAATKEHVTSSEPPRSEKKSAQESAPEDGKTAVTPEVAEKHDAHSEGKQTVEARKQVHDGGKALSATAKHEVEENEVKDHARSIAGETAQRQNAAIVEKGPASDTTSAKLEVTSEHETTSARLELTAEHEAPITPSGGEQAHWGYEGEASPENWALLSPQYKACGQGIEQTPIDLTSGIKSDVTPAFFNYKEGPLRISNNGHTIQINAAPGSFLTIAGKKYELAQFHFHHPSEHLLDGKAFPVELHLVHKGSDGTIAVVGVFFKIGKMNSQIEQIFRQMPHSKSPEMLAKGTNNPSALLPKGRAFYRYMGSLTTPPCTEGLTWTVFKEPLELSQEQVDQLATLFPHNARPVQPRNRRFLLEASAK